LVGYSETGRPGQFTTNLHITQNASGELRGKTPQCVKVGEITMLGLCGVADVPDAEHR
jgi:hypothetical protein